MSRHRFTLTCPKHGIWIYPDGDTQARNAPLFEMIHGACVKWLDRLHVAPPMKSRKR